jgi:6-phosphogluconolactonase
MMTRVVYLSCGGDRSIQIYRLDPDGALHPLTTVSIPGTEEPSSSTPLAVLPSRQFLYAALRTPPYPVTSFTIDQATGGLTPLATASLPHSMAYIATEPSGRSLLAASYPGALVSVSDIGPDGAIRAVASQVLQTPPKAHCIRPTPSGDFVYATTLGGDAILRWHFSNGRLDEYSLRLTPLHAGAGPRHLEFGANGTVFCLNETDATLDMLSEQSGELVHRQTLSLLPGEGKRSAADLHITPDRRLLYASERTSHTLHGFRVAAGSLTPISVTKCEATPRGFAIDPDGRYLLCAGQTEDALGVYRIHPTNGALQRVARHTTGPNPNWIEIIDL